MWTHKSFIDTATAVLINNSTVFGWARRLPNPALGAVWHGKKKAVCTVQSILFTGSELNCLPSFMTLSYCLQI